MPGEPTQKQDPEPQGLQNFQKVVAVHDATVPRSGVSLVEAGAVEIRLRNHEARIEANHDSLAKLRDRSAEHDTKISVITTELRETREDLGEIRRELTWVKRGLWAAAGTFLMFFVAAFSLLLSLSGNG